MGGKVLELESERLIAIGRAEGMAEGMAEGKAEGKAEGEARMAKLVNLLIAEGKNEEVLKVTSDTSLREQYYKIYHID